MDLTASQSTNPASEAAKFTETFTQWRCKMFSPSRFSEGIKHSLLGCVGLVGHARVIYIVAFNGRMTLGKI